MVGCRSGLRGGSEELVARGVAGGVDGGSWRKNSAILGAKQLKRKAEATIGGQFPGN